MQKYTHLVVGGFTAALTGWVLYGIPLVHDLNKILALQHVQSAELPFLIFTEKTPLIIQGAIFGILPDLDHLFKGLLDHRCGLTHSVLSFTIFAMVPIYILSLYYELPPYLTVLGAACIFSHWFIDAFNPMGVRTLGFSLSFLRKHRCELRIARIRYNNHAANLIFCTFCLGILLLLSKY